MNLFEKYGGQNFWDGFLTDFYKKIVVSPVVRHYYHNKDVGHIKEVLLGLLEVVMISYSHFSEQAIQDSHKELRIKKDEFDEWLNIFRQSLKEHQVDDEDIHYMIDVLTHYRPFIVENSDE